MAYAAPEEIRTPDPQIRSQLPATLPISRNQCQPSPFSNHRSPYRRSDVYSAGCGQGRCREVTHCDTPFGLVTARSRGASADLCSSVGQTVETCLTLSRHHAARTAPRDKLGRFVFISACAVNGRIGASGGVHGRLLPCTAMVRARCASAIDRANIWRPRS